MSIEEFEERLSLIMVQLSKLLINQNHEALKNMKLNGRHLITCDLSLSP
jgi:hypothetical protein